MNKRKKISVWVKIVTRVRLLLGLMPANVEQCRFAFKTAKAQGEKDSIRLLLFPFLYLRMFTLKWDQVFKYWLKIANTEDQAKELFFVSREYTVGLDISQEHRNLASEKWLSFLTNWKNKNHRKMVARLADEWLEIGTPIQRLALARRMEFLGNMVAFAHTEELAIVAYYYINDAYGSYKNLYRRTPEFKAASRNLEQIRKSKMNKPT